MSWPYIKIRNLEKVQNIFASLSYKIDNLPASFALQSSEWPRRSQFNSKHGVITEGSLREHNGVKYFLKKCPWGKINLYQDILSSSGFEFFAYSMFGFDKINDGSQKRTKWGEIFSDGMSMWDKSRCVRKWGKFNLYQVDLSFLFIQCLDKINDSSQKSYNKVSWHFGYPMLQWNCQIGNMTHNTLEINVSFQMLLKIYTV